MQKINLPNVTLVSVAGVRSQSSLNAIKKSKEDIIFAKSILISSEDIIDDEVEIHKIPNINYEEYNKFVIYELYKYIDTEFALLIQDDGYVINPHKWSDEFLNYDYIGAPWGLPGDNYSFRDHFGNLVRVGNGGFSLRSKKLMSLPTKLNIPWSWFFGYCNEDGFISCHHRHTFEENGCIFAPLEIAANFSHETEIPETQNIVPFGFHGKYTKYYKQL